MGHRLLRRCFVAASSPLRWCKEREACILRKAAQSFRGFMLTLVFLIVWFFAILALGLSGAFEALWNGKPIGPPLAFLIPLGIYFADLYWLKARLFQGFWKFDEKTAIMVQV